MLNVLLVLLKLMITEFQHTCCPIIHSLAFFLNIHSPSVLAYNTALVLQGLVHIPCDP